VINKLDGRVQRGVYKLVITGGINVETPFNSPLNIPIQVVLDFNYLFNTVIPSELLNPMKYL